MTFAEYNTDDNYADKNSSLEELVRLGLSEGNTPETIKASLSPAWQKSKMINEFDNYVQKYSNPSNLPESNIQDRDKDYLDNTTAIANEIEDKERERQQLEKEERYNSLFDTFQKQGEAFGKIDDKMISMLPTFAIKRYKNGEFGDLSDPDEKKKAKARLSYFIVDKFANALKGAANGANAALGRPAAFADTTSEYDKWQNSNLEKALENRWKKYNAETDAAIALATKQGVDEQDLQSAIAKISSSNRLQTAFNMMNEKQKVYTLKILAEIGDSIGNMNNKEFVNTFIGMITSGQDLDWKEAVELLGLRYGDDVIKNLKGDGFPLSADGNTVTAGFGGGGKPKNWTTTYVDIDGNEVTFDKIENQDGKNKLRSMMDDLSTRYYNGQIDEATFKKYYEPLYDESRKHTGTKSKSFDAILAENKKNKKTELEKEVKELNKKAKKMSAGDYNTAFNAIAAKAKPFGIDLSSLYKQAY